MTNWRGGIALRALCAIGIHPHVWVGGGLCDDAMECRVCGRDKYPEAFGLALFKFKRPILPTGQYAPRISPTPPEEKEE